MGTRRKIMAVLIAILVIGLSASCTSTGQYMPLSNDETIIGTVQSIFVIKSTSSITSSGRDKVSQQAYVILMEAAGKKYPGAIDLRDIVWVTGRDIDYQSKEISATGKVIRINMHEMDTKEDE